jgi:hypothetical protein
MARPWGENAAVIRAVLKDLGPMTCSEVQKEAGLTRNSVTAVVSRIHRSGEAHITDYAYDDEGARRYPRAVYAWGAGKDAKKPKSNLSLDRSNNERLANNRIKTASVFNLGMTRAQCRQIRRVAIGGAGEQNQQ